MAGANVLLLSPSPGYVSHARLALGPATSVEAVAPDTLGARAGAAPDLVIVHVSSIAPERRAEVFTRLRATGAPLAVAADVPNLDEMLDLSRFEIRAYFNAYMADVHYRQMLRMLCDGLTWFSPPLMSGALALARRTRAAEAEPCATTLAPLTGREREIAGDVAAGLSNREIATERRIKERTVKSHLTRIFKKLGVRSRHALAVKLREG